MFDWIKESGKPVVWSMHDCWAFTGHCAHFVNEGCEKWKTGCFNCPKKNGYPKSQFIDNSKKNYEKKKKIFTSLSNLTLVTPSEWLAYLVRESFLGKYEVKVIPNGINLEIFKPTESDFKEKHNLTDKKIILGAATAWSESKGISLFSEIAEKVDDSYKVVLVGITDEMRKKLSEKILSVPKTNSIEEMAEFYTASDVFLNISRAETMGLTTVEAMACGTPVVTSNLTAVPEVVREEGGVVAENLTAEDIVRDVEKVLSEKFENTRKNAEEYEKNNQFMKYLALYEEIL